MTIDAYILVGMVLAIVALYTVKTVRDRARTYEETHRRVQEAIDNITEDGIVEGPKGPYVPHRKWNVGVTRGTTGTGMPGYYGSTN